MNHEGELFITETLRYYLIKNHPELKYDSRWGFRSLFCKEMFDCNDCREYPKEFEAFALDEKENRIASIQVYLGFNICESSPVGDRYMEAYIHQCDITIFPLPMNDEGKLVCPNCDTPIEKISQTQSEIVRWSWNKKDCKYIKTNPDGDSEQCMCDHCGKHIGFDVGEFLGY